MAASRPIVSASRIRYAAPRRLERTQVQVAAQLADLVDQDRLALRLDEEQVGVLLDVDPVLVGAQHRGDEGVGRVVLARAPRPVQQVRVARIAPLPAPAADRPRAVRTAHARSAVQTRSATVATSASASTAATRAGSAAAMAANVSETAARNPSPSLSIRSASAASRGVVTRRIGAIRQQPAGGEQADVAHRVGAEAAPAALERDGRVDVPIADHPGAAGQRGSDHVGHQLRAARGEQQGLRARGHVPVAVVEHERPHALAERRPTRLAALDHLVAGGAQTLRQEAGLRRLADAVEALEGDEHRTKAKGGRGNLPNQLSVSHPEQVIRLDTGAFRAARTARAARNVAYWIVLVVVAAGIAVGIAVVATTVGHGSPAHADEHLVAGRGRGRARSRDDAGRDLERHDRRRRREPPQDPALEARLPGRGREVARAAEGRTEGHLGLLHARQRRRGKGVAANLKVNIALRVRPVDGITPHELAPAVVLVVIGHP